MDIIKPFNFAPMPEIHFGLGVRHQLLEYLLEQPSANTVILCSQTLSQPGFFGDELRQALTAQHPVQMFTVSGEPSPELVDEIVIQCPKETASVIGIGGGSVLDAAKAVAGLIPSQTSVMDYLEGVGAGKPFNVNTCPFIAVPTTAGTGSETTKNAVLSELGQFKKSFRDDKLLAKQAWLDPELLETCPQDVLFATGMDAFTQLLESYTTLKPNPITDALAWQGMTLFKNAFGLIESDSPAQKKQGYSQLMIAAMLSGTTLANAGLGAVHGLAGPIGAFFDAPHGIVCARLLAPITKLNINALSQQKNTSAKATLEKYKQVAMLLEPKLTPEHALQGLIKNLDALSQRYAPQGLSTFGLTKDNLDKVLQNCRSGSMLGNPVTLSDEDLTSALNQAL
jgi:alcohol dehydrogenase class IV